MKRHAFTLIELLVVIAMLAIVGAIAFPIVDRYASSPAKEVTVNIKHILPRTDVDGELIDFEVFTDQGIFNASRKVVGAIYAISDAPGQVFTYRDSRFSDHRWVIATRANTVPSQVEKE